MVSRVNSWDIEEQIVLVHFRSHNIKLSAVQRLLQLKCPGKAYRTDRAVQTRIDILNQYERRKGRAALRGLLPGSWADRTVIDEWLVRQTTDTELFKRLTWLGDEELNIITEEVGVRQRFYHFPPFSASLTPPVLFTMAKRSFARARDWTMGLWRSSLMGPTIWSKCIAGCTSAWKSSSLDK